jgi:SAM-dependent methyltransferase
MKFSESCENKEVIISPEVMQEQIRLPREQWSHNFLDYVVFLTKKNEIEIKDYEEYIVHGKDKNENEFKKEDIYSFEENGEKFERYMNMLGLTKEQIENKIILDLGCGEGEFVKHCIDKKITNKVYGIDIDIYDKIGIESNIGKREQIRIDVDENYKGHLLQGDFTKELPIKNIDYVISMGAVSTIIDKVQYGNEMERSIESALNAINENGEIRIWPIFQVAKATPEEYFEKSWQNWKVYLEKLARNKKIEYELEPREIDVIGKDNTIRLISTLIIRKRKQNQGI